MTLSIHSRIILSALVVLILFMSLTGFVLDKAFRQNIEYSQRENLRTQIYTLLAAAEIDDDAILQLPEEMTEPRLNIYESTLHARILTVADKVVWQSKSMANTALPLPRKIKMGTFSFSRRTLNNKTYALMNFTTIWVTSKGEYAYVLQVAENASVLNSQINNFRQSLWMWLVGVSILLIIIQTIILRWGLKPLRHVAEDLLEIENGNKKRLIGKYPKEINTLTQNLNQLLDSSSQQLSRYRDSLGNMAHSLKTPIAVLQGIINNSNIKEKNSSLDQLNNINKIVEHQLQRAATVGKSQLNDAILLKPIAQKIVSTLDKVYKDKKVETQLTIPDTLELKINEGDLYELLGNLIENAFKWCDTKVHIRAEVAGRKTSIIIEDDGAGISKEQRELILLRGQRVDQTTPGHGLGLAMVSEMLLLYEGFMEIVESKLGGAKIVIKI